jgi:hypothetical protein
MRNPGQFVPAAVARRHRAVLLAAAVITLLSVLLLFRLKLDASLDSWISTKDRRTRLILEDLRDTGSQDVLIVGIEIPGPERFESSRLLAETFASELRKVPGAGSVEARVSDRYRKFFEEILLPNAPLYLPASARTELVKRLQPDSIRRQVAENKRLLTTPGQSGVERLVLNDPLRIKELVLRDWFDRKNYPGLEVRDGYLVDRGQRYLLVFCRPEEPARNVAFSRRLLAGAEEAAEAARAGFRRNHPGVEQVPSFTFAGGYVIAERDEALTRRDLKLTLLLSLCGVSLLFFAMFRSLFALALLLVPLGCSVLWTFGAAALAFGPVNMLTGVFAAVLVGLGVDFAIHYLNAYVTLRRERDHDASLQSAWHRSAHAILTGGLTSALAFLVLGFSGFQGFRQLGLLAGIGLLFCLVNMLVVLPALLNLRVAGRFTRRSHARLPLVGAVTGRVLSRPRTVLIVSLAALAILCIKIPAVSFDPRLASLRPQGGGSDQAKIEEILGGASGYVTLVSGAKSEEVLLDRLAPAVRRLSDMAERGELSHLQSVLSFLPAPAYQEETRAFLRKHERGLQPERIEEDFRDALEEAGFAFPSEYEAYLEWLKNCLDPDIRVASEDFRREGLQSLLKPFLARKEERVKAIVYIYPLHGLGDEQQLREFRKKVEAAAERGGLDRTAWRLGGLPVLTQLVKKQLFAELDDLLLLVGASVLAVLLVMFRRPGRVLLACIPVAAGVTALLGGMGLLGLPFNYANFIMLPVIVGLGIDDGIHLVGRWSREPQTPLRETAAEIGRAIVLTSLTTMIGFGSLAVSSYPGIRSIGYVAIIGITACMLASLALLPAVLALVRSGKK